MPICFIYTNLPDSAIPSDFEDKLIECVSGVLIKPKEKISVIVNAGCRMAFAGKHQQGLLCQIHSINVFDAERNPGYFPKISECLTASTKLDPKSVCIEFVDLPAHMAKTGL